MPAQLLSPTGNGGTSLANAKISPTVRLCLRSSRSKDPETRVSVDAMGKEKWRPFFEASRQVSKEISQLGWILNVLLLMR